AILGENDEELVAADAQRHAALAGESGKPPADLAQHGVGPGAPQELVDVAEIVEIEHDEGKRAAARLGAGELGIDEDLRAGARRAQGLAAGRRVANPVDPPSVLRPTHHLLRPVPASRCGSPRGPRASADIFAQVSLSFDLFGAARGNPGARMGASAL